ncbi:MAG: aldehyde dehydrogenase family protein [Saprospiraceae bacterium]|nr:aldehyde dehydrogenase family protein [Saprospiraceae bacterium]
MESSISRSQTRSIESITALFEQQKQHQYEVARSSVRARIKKLKRLKNCILKYRSQIQEALYNDFRKHPSEVDMTEIYPTTSEIKHTCAHLKDWMCDEKVVTPIALLGSTSYIHKEPKGVVLIISPWNFPINLTFGPLVSAIAAGNCVILKPSEHTPHASSIMRKIVEECFDEKEVALVEGAVETAQQLLSLPFNHIFFTGSPAVGKIVMGAAAKNLASVTLELGGKSPTIVDETASVDVAARRIAWGKFVNNGQICIAPDYVFVHKSKMPAFKDKIKSYIHKFYSEDPSQEVSYARMVNNNHYKRVLGYQEDAINKGAHVIHGGKTKHEEDYIEPTLLENVPMDSELMTEEIFGPLLPLHSYENIDDVIKIINGREKPLALYIYSRNKKKINHILNNTRAGGSCINHTGVHFYNTHLPFGGSNNSGIGKAGGKAGFDAFTNNRGILKQNMPNALELLTPPYNNFKQKLIDFTIKYL